MYACIYWWSQQKLDRRIGGRGRGLVWSHLDSLDPTKENGRPPAPKGKKESMVLPLELYDRGAELRVLKPSAGGFACMHVKTAIFDRKTVLTGSVNTCILQLVRLEKSLKTKSVHFEKKVYIFFRGNIYRNQTKKCTFFSGGSKSVRFGAI